MGLYIRGDRYYFKKQIQGKTHYRALRLKRGQERLLSARLKQVEEEVLAKHFGIPYSPHEPILFHDYLERYLKEKKHKKWKRDQETLLIINKCLRNPPLSVIGKKHINKLEQYLFARKIKASTVNRYFEVLKHFLNVAIEDGYTIENPVKKFYKPFAEAGQRRALAEEEIKQILESARSIQENPKSKVQAIIYDLILFALNTGMRLSEILNLKKSYIRDDVIFYPVTETKYSRRVYNQNKKVKAICLNDVAMGILEKQKGDDFVFPLKWRNPNVIRKTMVKIRETSGVNDFTFHQLRHTVSTIVSSQVSLATAKTILGHADIKTTLKYTHPGIEEQRKGVAKIGQYFKSLQG